MVRRRTGAAPAASRFGPWAAVAMLVAAARHRRGRLFARQGQVPAVAARAGDCSRRSAISPGATRTTIRPAIRPARPRLAGRLAGRKPRPQLALPRPRAAVRPGADRPERAGAGRALERAHHPARIGARRRHRPSATRPRALADALSRRARGAARRGGLDPGAELRPAEHQRPLRPAMLDHADVAPVHHQPDPRRLLLPVRRAAPRRAIAPRCSAPATSTWTTAPSGCCACTTGSGAIREEGQRDREIFRHAAARIREMGRQGPFIATLISASNHHPFRSPEPALDIVDQRAGRTAHPQHRPLHRRRRARADRDAAPRALVRAHPDRDQQRPWLQSGRAWRDDRRLQPLSGIGLDAVPDRRRPSAAAGRAARRDRDPARRRADHRRPDRPARGQSLARAQPAQRSAPTGGSCSAFAIRCWRRRRSGARSSTARTGGRGSTMRAATGCSSATSRCAGRRWRGDCSTRPRGCGGIMTGSSGMDGCGRHLPATQRRTGWRRSSLTCNEQAGPPIVGAYRGQRGHVQAGL